MRAGTPTPARRWVRRPGMRRLAAARPTQRAIQLNYQTKSRNPALAPDSRSRTRWETGFCAPGVRRNRLWKRCRWKSPVAFQSRSLGFSLVARTGIEPASSALRGRCPNQLDDRAMFSPSDLPCGQPYRRPDYTTGPELCQHLFAPSYHGAVEGLCKEQGSCYNRPAHAGCPGCVAQAHEDGCAATP